MAEWKGIIQYMTNGNYRADNNYAEQCIRDLAVGRKNFFFKEAATQPRTWLSPIYSLRAANFAASIL